MAFQDQTLTCRDCGNTFTWTAGEQEFYASRGFSNAPTRCQSCRTARKAQQRNGGGDFRGGNDHRGPRQSFEITCANCGKKDTVPFQPRGDRPVLCRDCFQQQRQAA